MTARLQDSAVTAILAALGGSLWLQWGVGSAAPSSANAVSGTGAEARVAATVTVTGSTLSITGTIFAANDGVRNITEVGVFNAAGAGTPPTGGQMFFYGDFPALQISLAGQGITFGFNITF